MRHLNRQQLQAFREKGLTSAVSVMLEKFRSTVVQRFKRNPDALIENVRSQGIEIRRCRKKSYRFAQVIEKVRDEHRQRSRVIKMRMGDDYCPEGELFLTRQAN
jgi:hypothetical protein